MERMSVLRNSYLDDKVISGQSRDRVQTCKALDIDQGIAASAMYARSLPNLQYVFY